MPNSAKTRGDRGERDAVRFLEHHVPAPLLCSAPQRRLGLGRHLDTGDLDVFNDVCVQVKSYTNVGSALRLAAEGAEKQRTNAKLPYGVGMVVRPNEQKLDVARWLFVAIRWPTMLVDVDIVVNNSSDLLVALSATKHKPMLAALTRGSSRTPLYVSWITRWVRDYQEALQLTA